MCYRNWGLCVCSSGLEAAVVLLPRVANEKKGASAPFVSGDARCATVGAHLGAMAVPVMPIARKCAPTNRWVRARMFEKLAAEAAPAKAQAASGCTAAEARRPGQSMKPTATAARIQQ